MPKAKGTSTRVRGRIARADEYGFISVTKSTHTPYTAPAEALELRRITARWLDGELDGELSDTSFARFHQILTKI